MSIVLYCIVSYLKHIEYPFFGNVVRGKHALFRFVARNGFASFVRKFLARVLGFAPLKKRYTLLSREKWNEVKVNYDNISR